MNIPKKDQIYVLVTPERLESLIKTNFALFKVTNCDLKLIFKTLYSSFIVSNMKSCGKRPILRRTACFKTFVST